MCDLASIVSINATQVIDQGYHIELDWNNTTVRISHDHPPYKNIFLDFEWADVFLSRVVDLRQQLPDVDDTILSASVAKLYL